MPNLFNYDNRDLGSLDPFAFRGQFPGSSKRTTAYEEISRLSMRAESLKQENEIMKLELFELVTTHNDPFSRLKKSLIEFAIRLTHREREVDEVRRHLSASTNTVAPTFVEVDVHRYRHASFDLVATSLLVSNEQRHFFRAADLRRQNEELLALIENQEEGLKMIRSRLQLYAQCQQQNSIRLKLESLRRGESPSIVADIAPDQIFEQRMKIKMLSRDLAELVAQRKQLSQTRAAKHSKPKQTDCRQMAIKIQAVWRGFVARKRLKEWRQSAIRIQKWWRAITHPVREPPARHPERSRRRREEARQEEQTSDVPAEETTVDVVEGGQEQQTVESAEERTEVEAAEGRAEIEASGVEAAEEQTEVEAAEGRAEIEASGAEAAEERTEVEAAEGRAEIEASGVEAAEEQTEIEASGVEAAEERAEVEASGIEGAEERTEIEAAVVEAAVVEAAEERAEVEADGHQQAIEGDAAEGESALMTLDRA
jgi:hypothetical protein